MNTEALIEVGRQLAAISECSSKDDGVLGPLLSFKNRPLFPWVENVIIDVLDISSEKNDPKKDEVEVTVFFVPFPTEKMLRKTQKGFVKAFLLNSAIFQEKLYQMGYRYNRPAINEGTFTLNKKVRACHLEKEVRKLIPCATLGSEHDPMAREMGKYHKPHI